MGGGIGEAIYQRKTISKWFTALLMQFHRIRDDLLNVPYILGLIHHSCYIYTYRVYCNNGISSVPAPYCEHSKQINGSSVDLINNLLH